MNDTRALLQHMQRTQRRRPRPGMTVIPARDAQELAPDPDAPIDADLVRAVLRPTTAAPRRPRKGKTSPRLGYRRSERPWTSRRPQTKQHRPRPPAFEPLRFEPPAPPQQAPSEGATNLLRGLRPDQSDVELLAGPPVLPVSAAELRRQLGSASRASGAPARGLDAAAVSGAADGWGALASGQRAAAIGRLEQAAVRQRAAKRPVDVAPRTVEHDPTLLALRPLESRPPAGLSRFPRRPSTAAAAARTFVAGSSPRPPTAHAITAAAARPFTAEPPEPEPEAPAPVVVARPQTTKPQRRPTTQHKRRSTHLAAPPGSPSDPWRSVGARLEAMLDEDLRCATPPLGLKPAEPSELRRIFLRWAQPTAGARGGGGGGGGPLALGRQGFARALEAVLRPPRADTLEPGTLEWAYDGFRQVVAPRAALPPWASATSLSSFGGAAAAEEQPAAAAPGVTLSKFRDGLSVMANGPPAARVKLVYDMVAARSRRRVLDLTAFVALVRDPHAALSDVAAFMTLLLGPSQISLEEFEDLVGANNRALLEMFSGGLPVHALPPADAPPRFTRRLRPFPLSFRWLRATWRHMLKHSRVVREPSGARRMVACRRGFAAVMGPLVNHARALDDVLLRRMYALFAGGVCEELTLYAFVHGLSLLLFARGRRELRMYFTLLDFHGNGRLQDLELLHVFFTLGLVEEAGSDDAEDEAHAATHEFFREFAPAKSNELTEEEFVRGVLRKPGLLRPLEEYIFG